MVEVLKAELKMTNRPLYEQQLKEGYKLLRMKGERK